MSEQQTRGAVESLLTCLLFLPTDWKGDLSNVFCSGTTENVVVQESQLWRVVFLEGCSLELKGQVEPGGLA